MVFRQIDSDAAEQLDESSWAASGNRFLNRKPGSTDQCVKTFRMRFKVATFAMQDNNKRWSSPKTLFRVSSILMVGLMIGHMSAYPWISIKAPQEEQLRTLMKSLPFVFMGERSTYWNLYFGWGILVGVLLLTLAGILWILSDVTTLRPRSSGAISAVISTTSLVGAYLSFRFFYIPPFVLFSIICTTLLAATVQLLNRRNE